MISKPAFGFTTGTMSRTTTLNGMADLRSKDLVLCRPFGGRDVVVF